MSENRYTIEGLVGKFRLVHKDADCRACAAYGGAFRSCIAEARHDIECGFDKVLELIPGTDAPAVDPRDAEIAELRAKLSAMESAKPLAVLPPLTGDEPVKAICADIGRIDHDPISDDEMDIAVWGVEIGYALALSRIQPVNPEYLAALEEMAKAGNELREELYNHAEGNMVFPELQAADAATARLARARLAAGKGEK